MTAAEPPVRTIEGAPSWSFNSDRVRAHVTRDGGHLGPITFLTPKGPVRPMAVAPWAREVLPPGSDLVLRPLRGDFFCAPFGGNAAPWRGKQLPAHGEVATGRWTSARVTSTADGAQFSAKMRTRLIPGLVTKMISLRREETNVYVRHVLEGFSGPLCLGHHAMLSFPKDKGPGHISLSPWREGRVCPEPFEAPEKGGYFALRTGAPFRSLRRVPLLAGGAADLSVYPAREGFEDLVMVSSIAGQKLGWTAVCFPKAGYLWFALKDPRTLASTVLWHSNGGRHYPPWNGRHRQVLGLEEVTAYFHLGQVPSASSNPLSRKGVPTVLNLRPDHALAINYVMGVAALPRKFDHIASIRAADGGILLTAASGAQIHHRVTLGFIYGDTP